MEEQAVGEGHGALEKAHVERVSWDTSKSVEKRASKKRKKRMVPFFCEIDEGKFGADHELNE
jgi:hypothetical protein